MHSMMYNKIDRNKLQQQKIYRLDFRFDCRAKTKSLIVINLRQ